MRLCRHVQLTELHSFPHWPTFPAAHAPPCRFTRFFSCTSSGRAKSCHEIVHLWFTNEFLHAATRKACFGIWLLHQNHILNCLPLLHKKKPERVHRNESTLSIGSTEQVVIVRNPPHTDTYTHTFLFLRNNL